MGTLPLIQGWVNYDPWAKSGLLPGFANKILCGRIYIGLFTYWQFQAAKAELSSSDKNHMALYRKCFLTPV